MCVCNVVFLCVVYSLRSLRTQHAASLLGTARFIVIWFVFLRTQHAASLLSKVRFIFICFVFFADAARCVPTRYSAFYFYLFWFFYGRSTLRPYRWCVLLKQSYCHCKILFSIYSDMLLKSLRLRIAWS